MKCDMKRRVKRRHFLLGMAGLAACARDPRPRLNVYNWSAYVDRKSTRLNSSH